jgi:hypothetical protein
LQDVAETVTIQDVMTNWKEFAVNIEDFKEGKWVSFDNEK